MPAETEPSPGYSDRPRAGGGRAGHDGSEPARGGERAQDLGVELTGDLPCVVCRYNLRGLSVRATCPECGAPVGVTILARVDPKADELKPIAAPRLAAVGLVLWPASAALAALCLWAMHGYLMFGELAGLRLEWSPALVVASSGGIVLSAVGALVIGLSAAGLRDAASGRAVCVAMLYLPLLALHWWIHTRLDPPVAPVYPPGLGGGLRFVLHAAVAVLTVAVLLGMRVTFRAIVARSRLLRSGKIGRQELLPLAVTQVLVLGGDSLLYAGSQMDDATGGALRYGGTFLVGLGSMLLTIGLVSLTADAVRLTPYVSRRIVGPRDVLPEPGRRRDPSGADADANRGGRAEATDGAG